MFMVSTSNSLSSAVIRRGLNASLALWFLMNAGFFLLIPLLTVHFVDELGWAAAFVGLVLALRQFTQQTLTVFGGALADRVGAKRLIMVGVLVRTVSFVFIGFATTPYMLLAGGILAALGGSLFDAPNRALIATLAPEESLNDLYARVGILQNAARTVGPLLGSAVILVDFRLVGLVAAGFFFFSFFIAWVGMPDVPISTGKQRVLPGLHLVMRDRAFVTYTVFLMGYWFMWVQMSIALPLEAKALSGSNSSVGILFAINAVSALIMQIPVLRLAERFLQPMPMLIMGVLAMAVGLGSVIWVHSSGQLYGAVFMYALGTVLVMPNSQTVAATMANPAARGAYFGVNSLALAVGGGVGQALGGTAVDLAAALNFPPLPWVVSAAAGLIAAAGLLHFYNHNRCRVTPRGLLADCDD